MRQLAAALCLLALVGCGDRRDFDERYDDTSKQLEDRARALDQNLANELPADLATRRTDLKGWRTRHEYDGHSDHWEISVQLRR
jgi:hypothetical protein